MNAPFLAQGEHGRAPRRRPVTSATGNGAPEFQFPYPVPPSQVETSATREGEGWPWHSHRWGLRKTVRSPEWQQSYARPSLVDRQEGASLDVLSMRLDGVCNDAYGTVGEQVLGADLDHTRRRASAGRQDRREVEVVDDDEVVLVRPRQDLDVWRGRCPDGGPVDGLEPVTREPAHPAWRQVHVDEQFHGRRSGTSTSSARQAA